MFSIEVDGSLDDSKTSFNWLLNSDACKIYSCVRLYTVLLLYCTSDDAAFALWNCLGKTIKVQT